jgi:hypothetical protein
MHQTTPWALFHIEESGLLPNPIPTLCASCCPHCQVQTPATKQPHIITMCCFHTKVTMIQNLQSNTINSITHVEIQQLKKKRIAFMGCEDQKEKDDITKILMEKKP